MKHTLFVLAVLCALQTRAAAQPTEQQVKSHYMKNGVTSVKVLKTVKEWDSKGSKYYYKVNLVKTQLVAPADVDGLTGVTLETHVLATYDIGRSTPYWGGVVFSEYKGIDLPTPSASEVTAMLQKSAAENPTRFFRSSSGKIGIDSIWTDDPKPEWINPRTLTVQATMRFKQEVNYTEIGVIEAPVGVKLQRPTIRGQWEIASAYQDVEQQKELSRIKKSDAGGDAVSMADKALEQKNRADMERLNVPIPQKFTSVEGLVDDINEKLFTLSRDQFDYYLIMSMTPDLRCTGCVYTPTANGNQLGSATLAAAYDGTGTFRDQFCSRPNKLTVNGSTAYFHNREGGGESYIMTRKVGEHYFVESITLRVSKDAGENASMKSMGCADASTTSVPSDQKSWSKGDQVMVEENGKWYPSVILDVRSGEYYIHYDGYSNSYDTWVKPERVRSR